MNEPEGKGKHNLPGSQGKGGGRNKAGNKREEERNFLMACGWMSLAS